MRIAGAAAIVVTLSLPATAGDLESQFRFCRQKSGPAERLGCLDAIVLPDLPVTPAAAPLGNWVINEERSPLDDSPGVTASLVTSTGGTNLIFAVRCKEGRTEAFVTADQILGFSQTLEVQYRMGQTSPARANWNASTTGRGAFAPRGAVISLVRSIPSDGTMFFRVRGQTSLAEASFVTRGVDEVRRKIAAACRWPGEAPRR